MRAYMVVMAVLLTAAPAAEGRSRSAVPATVPGELIVAFEAGTAAEQRAQARQAAGVRVARSLRLPRTQLLRAADRGRALRELRADPRVRYAQPNRVRRRADFPDDPLFGELWGLHNGGGVAGFVADADIDAPEAWDVSVGSPAVVVAVVDEGVDYTHPDLVERMWDGPGTAVGFDWVDADADPIDEGGHGTHVAGTIAAAGNDGKGITGVAWDARIMALRVLGASGGTDADIADAFDYAADNGARIVNASLGGPGASPVIADVVAAHPDVLYAVAAGNGDEDGVGYSTDLDPDGYFPCNIAEPNLVCVAATTPSDGLASFSNFGSASVDLGAPGQAIKSTLPTLVGRFEESFANSSDWTFAPPWGVAGGSDKYLSLGLEYSSGPDSAASLDTPVDLSGLSRCRVEYLASHSLAAGDYVALQRSITGGAEWTTIRQHVGTVPSWEAFAWDGHSANLLADGAANVRLRFLLHRAGGGKGFDADDLRVVCQDEGIAAYDVWDGTSMATPHVSGVAALLLARLPGAEVADLRDGLLRGGDSISALAGRTASGRRLNAAGALAVLSQPRVETGPAAAVSATSARLTGTIAPRGTQTWYAFEYGTTPGLGSQTALTDAQAGTASAAVGADLNGLAPNTTYHFRLVAVRGADRYPGATRTFVTPAPTVATPVTDAPSDPQADPPVLPVFGADARSRCRSTRVGGRRVVRCSITAVGAERVKLRLRRRGKVVARARGAAGRTLKLRPVAERRLRRGRYRLHVTLFASDGAKASLRRSLKLR